MSQSVYCTTESPLLARQIVDHLKSAGFPDTRISILVPDNEKLRALTGDDATMAPEGAAAGMAAGSMIGGAVGLAAGLSALAIPGIGPFLAAGPILAAVSGIAVGAAVGGIAGALIGLGIPEAQAQIYEGRLRQGRVLVSAHTDDPAQVRRAEAIFLAEGATDIFAISEPTVTV
jgi:hypothetical protein